MLSSKRGAAILQVLLVAAVLAGISALLLRASLSRSSSARQTRRTVAAQLEIESCMAQVNQLWSIKSPEVFARDMHECIFYCESSDPNAPCSADKKVTEFRCPYVNTDAMGLNPQVTAMISGATGNCQITYTVNNAQNL